MDHLDVSTAAAEQHRGLPSFEEFYAAELPRLVVLARGLCPPGVAEDIAQEAMLAAYRKWDHVARLERPDLWARRACANLAVSSFRRKMVELRVVGRLANRRDLPPVSEDTEEFWRAVRALPKRQAQAAALRFVYDLPIADIAAVLSCSEGTVKQHLSRARRALSDTLGIAEGSAESAADGGDE
ncbi:MAG: sigma-70 family RNA polymerase sigma factor [Nocardioides sp.]|uniref:sigma-70 family RNA polymerase sigma factor n=1 Tax=Nocardioides sp. TaxID=35761 RepID=UPI0039E5895F